MRLLSRIVAVASLVAVAVACGRGRGTDGIRFTKVEPVGVDSVYVEVINDNFYDARVHVIYDGGGRFSVGTITGQGRQNPVAIPWHPRPLIVQVMMIVEDAVYVTDRIDVVRGDVLQVRLPTDFRTSGWFRRVSE